MLRPGERVGNWIVDHPLAEGGMGAVYRVHSPLTTRLAAALKIMKPTGEPDARARFVREAEALAALRHPAIVRVMEFAEDASRGLLYLVMELAEGQTLRERIERGPMELAAALNTFLPLARGLEHTHACGVFHRDLKPSNIILCSDGSVRLVDFGIAAAEHSEPLTNTGRLGTLAYLPPEVFKDEKTEPESVDVYGFGLVLYEALTGQRSFPVDPRLTPAAAAASMGLRKVQNPSSMELPEHFPLALRELVRRATAPEPADRPNMTEVRAGLEQTAGRAARTSSRASAEPVPSPLQVADEATMRVPDPTEEPDPSTAPGRRLPRLHLVTVVLAALLGLGATFFMGRSWQHASSAATKPVSGPLASPTPMPAPSRMIPAPAPASTPEKVPEARPTASPSPAAVKPVASPSLPASESSSPVEPVEADEPAAEGRQPAASELGGRWELTLEEPSPQDPATSRRGGYRLVLQQEGDHVYGRGYKLSENGVALPQDQRTAIEVDGRVEGQHVVLYFVERGGSSLSSGTIRSSIAPGGGALSGRFASDGGQGGSSLARRLR